ncbi:schwannomin-interacting protein 1 homolog [Prorops nasuta]|uniref:schwannomin-interacting protein 1 homolog n=1 Tax=Prorops nasuta TaxID=863751 RepID=UPI0034CFE836
MSNERTRGEYAMQLRESVAWVPLQSTALNNNQLGESEESHPNTEELANRNVVHQATAENIQEISPDESQDFCVAEYTATWSSLAIARDHIQLESKIGCSNVNNNNLAKSTVKRNSSLESLTDYEGRNSSREDSSAELTPSEWSDWSEDGNLPAGCRGIVNPNYPGFQHLAPSLLSDTDLTEDECEPYSDYPRQNQTEQLTTDPNDDDNNNNNSNNNNNHIDESINHLCGQESERKLFYEKPKFNIQVMNDMTVTSLYETPIVPSTKKCINYVKSVQDSRSSEEITTQERDTTLDIAIEAEPRVAALDQEELVVENFSHEREIPLDVEVVELSTSVKESPQFPEIEEILDSAKTSEIGELDDLIVEQIDLIREAKELPLPRNNKIGKATDLSASGSGDDSEPDVDSYWKEGKLEEIDLLSSIGRDIGVNLEKYVQPVPDVVAMEPVDHSRSDLIKEIEPINEDTNKIIEKTLPESADARKKEKMARNQAKRRQQQQYHQSRSTNSQRRSDKRRTDLENGTGGFDVYNIETAMPKIDLDAIESHLKAAKEEERRRRNDREEIRRRLAMGPDAEDLRAERGKKPSLQSRLQSGMNLQICFMNETPSDTESPGSESDGTPSTTLSSLTLGPKQATKGPTRPQVLSLPPLRLESGTNVPPLDEANFFARQARLQTEARMALAQAKEMAHMQMEVERQRLKQSPITEMVRCSLEKVGVQFGEERRRLSRALLTELNVAQLQVIANDLHARIATLNEALVEGLLRRDDLHMEQDSMLVDVEDLTRYLGAKQESLKKKQSAREKNGQPQQQPQQQQQQQHKSHQQQQVKTVVKSKLTNRSLVGLVRK